MVLAIITALSPRSQPTGGAITRELNENRPDLQEIRVFERIREPKLRLAALERENAVARMQGEAATIQFDAGRAEDPA